MREYTRRVERDAESRQIESERERERERESSLGSVRSVLLGRIGVPVVGCRLLTRPVRWSRIPPWSRNQRQQGRHLGEPGPSPVKRLNRALGSAYLPPRGTPCPPLLPPRRPLAKRKRTDTLSFTDPFLGRAACLVRSFLFFSFVRSFVRAFLPLPLPHHTLDR